MRLALALLAAAAAAALGALMLGEYQLIGWTPYIAGVLFGVAVAEVALSIARRRSPALVAPAAAFAAAGMVWAAWISAGRDWSYVPGGAWAGAALAPVAAVVWAVRLRG